MKKNIFIVMLVLIILGLCGYLVYYKVIDKDNINCSNKKNEILKEDKYTEKQVQIANELVSENLLHIVEYMSICGNGYEWDFKNNNKLTYDNLSEKEKYTMVYNYLDNKQLVHKGENYYIKKDDFKTGFSKIFGVINVDLPEEFQKTYIDFKLQNNEYIGTVKGMGCTANTLNYDLYDYKVYDNKFELYVALYTNNATIGEEGITIYGKNNELLEKISMTDKFDVDKYLDKLTKYKFVFNVKDDNYIFNSIESID